MTAINIAASYPLSNDITYSLLECVSESTPLIAKIQELSRFSTKRAKNASIEMTNLCLRYAILLVNISFFFSFPFFDVSDTVIKQFEFICLVTVKKYPLILLSFHFTLSYQEKSAQMNTEFVL